MLYGCKLMNSIKSNMTTHLSIGTLVVVGLHIVQSVTIANFVFGHLCHINGTICYQWNEAIPLAILITAHVPSFHQDIRMRIYYLKDQGSYAVWKATKANGGYDLKTFEVKARPIDCPDGLRPGMSLVLKRE